MEDCTAKNLKEISNSKKKTVIDDEISATAKNVRQEINRILKKVANLGYHGCRCDLLFHLKWNTFPEYRTKMIQILTDNLKKDEFHVQYVLSSEIINEDLPGWNPYRYQNKYRYTIYWIDELKNEDVFEFQERVLISMFEIPDVKI